MANLASAISVQGLGDRTADPPKDGSATIFKAEARPSTGSGRGEPVETRRSRSKEFLIKKYSELSELCASVVNIPSQETRKRVHRFHRLDETA